MSKPSGYHEGLVEVVAVLERGGTYTVKSLAEAARIGEARCADIVRELQNAEAISLVRKRPKIVELTDHTAASAVVRTSAARA